MEALLIVDMQNDFLEKGALGAPGGTDVISVINALIPLFPLVVASKDWHPFHHCSFKDDNNIKACWPRHCVQNTFGSELSNSLDLKRIKKIFYKGMLASEDSYSAFYIGEHHQSTGLKEFLEEKGVTRLVIVGLVLEHCVKKTALDAVDLGFNVSIIKEGVGALYPLGAEEIWQELKKKGINIILYNNFFTK